MGLISEVNRRHVVPTLCSPTLQTEQHFLHFTPHPPTLFEHDLSSVGGIGFGVQATCIAPCDGRFPVAAATLMDERVREAGHGSNETVEVVYGYTSLPHDVMSS